MAQFITDDDEDKLQPVDDTELPPIAENDLAEEPTSPTDVDPDGVLDETNAADQAQEGLAVDDPPVDDNAEVPPPDDAVIPAMPKHPYEKYADMMGKYQDLVEQKRKNNMMLGILAGGQIAGQAIAGGHSGKFDTDMSNIKMLEDMNGQRVTDYTNAVKQQGMDISLKDMQQLRDSTSKISEYYRSMARKRGMEVDNKMSAWDIQNMSKVLGKPGAAQAKFRVAPLVNQVTGEKQMGKIEQSTGNMYSMDGTLLGKDWFQHNVDRTIIDPNTGERKVFSGSLGKVVGDATGPGVSTPLVPTTTPGADGKPEFELNRSYLNADQRKHLDVSRKAFQADIKQERAGKNAALRIIDNLKNGKNIGDSPAEIMDQLSRAYGQTGHITDAQIGRAIGMADWQSRFNAAVSLAKDGKLDDANRSFLNKLATVIASQNERFINDKAQVYMNNLHQDWSTSPNLAKYKITPAHIGKLLSVDQAAMIPEQVTIQEVTKTGKPRVLKVSKEQAAIVTKGGHWKVLPGSAAVAPGPAMDDSNTGSETAKSPDEEEEDEE